MTLPIDLTDKLDNPIDAVIVGQITQVNDWGYGLSTEKIILQFPVPTITLHNSEADANNNVNGTAATLVTTVPGAGQLRIWYTDTTGKLGFVESNIAQNNKWLRISCKVSGDLVGSKKINKLNEIANDHETRLQSAEQAIASGNLISPDTVSAFRANQNAQQSLAATTWTKLNYQLEEFDNLNEYDAANSKFTAGANGIYLINASLRVDTQSDGNRLMLAVYKNGVNYCNIASDRVGSAGDGMVNGTVVLKLAAGDYIEMYGISIEAVTTSTYTQHKYFSITRIA